MTPVLGRTDIEQFRTIVTGHLGLQYEDGKLDYLADVIRQRMQSEGHARIESCSAYLGHLNASPKGSAEWRALAEQLTVNETFFFRNPDNFLALAEIVLPERIRAKAQTKQLRILSAGCSSGDEPYSLAIMVREALPDLDAWDVKIIGIDINPAILLKATKARYSEWSLRGTSEDVRRRYFRADGADFLLAPEIQKMVSFEERNLVDEDPLFWESLACDLVFCRNVLMYFTPETARGVVRRIGRALLPRGFLFLGHAETLRGITPGFHLCHTHDTFYYQQRDACDAAAKATWAAPPPAARGRFAARGRRINGVLGRCHSTCRDANRHAGRCPNALARAGRATGRAHPPGESTRRDGAPAPMGPESGASSREAGTLYGCAGTHRLVTGRFSPGPRRVAPARRPAHEPRQAQRVRRSLPPAARS